MKKFLLSMMLALCLPLAALAQDDTREMYTVFTEADSTLTFYYDNQKGTREGVTYEMRLYSNYQDWNDQARGIARAVIDESFVDARPTSTAAWFALGYWDDQLGSMSNLREIVGLHRLNTSSVTSMVCMFRGCSSLTTLDLSHFNTSKVTNMGLMFDGCSSLKALDLSHFDTSNVTSMNSMFSGCCMDSLDLSHFDTSKVTNMSSMFSGCRMASLDLSHFDTSNVTKMDKMFRSCGLTSLDLSHFDTHNVTDMTCMFWGCRSLRSLDVSSFNTSRVFSMSDEYTGGMFSYCSSLTSLDLSSFDTKNVADMYLMFYQCSSLKSLDLSNFDTSNVTYMSYMLGGCSSLAYVDIRGFNLQSIISAHSMFRDCSSLRYIRCEDDWNATYPELKSSNMFAGCVSLEGGAGTRYDDTKVDATYARLDTPEAPGYFTSEMPLSYAVYSSDNKTLSFYYDTNRGEREGTVYDCDYAGQDVPQWEECSTSTEKVVFDPSFAASQPTSTRSWFRNFSSLTEIDGLQYLNLEKVADMSEMLAGCSSLAAIDVSGINLSNVRSMRSLFEGCQGLTEIDLSVWDMKHVEDVESLFNGCSSLTTIYCNDDWSQLGNITSSAGMFNGCMSLVGGNGTAYDGSNTGIAYARVDSPEQPGYFTAKPYVYMVVNPADATMTFYYDHLQSQREGRIYTGAYESSWGDTYPDWVEDVVEEITTVVFDKSFAKYRPTKTAYWFFLFSSLTDIVGIENLNTEEVTDMSYMFQNCEQIEHLDLSHFNTANVTNMEGMFQNCTQLETVDLSSFNTLNVTNMKNMFIQCSNLASIDVSSFDTRNVTTMESMFALYKLEETDPYIFQMVPSTKLKSLDVSNFNTQNVTVMSMMFYGCGGLNCLDFSSFNFDNVSYRNGMFTSVPSDCVLYLPQGMTVSDFEGYKQGDLVHDAEKNVVETNEDGVATCDELVMADDNYFMVRTPFEAKKAVFQFHLNDGQPTAGMPRRINERIEEGTRVPIYIPFAFDAKQFGQVYEMGKLTADKTAVQFNEVQTPTTEANRPYIINSNGEDIVAENVMVEVSERMEATGADEMLGVIEQTLVPMGGYWFDVTNDKLVLAGEDEEVGVLAGRGYFLLPSANGSLSLDALFGPQIATEIDTLEGQSSVANEVYDLQGRRIANSASSFIHHPSSRKGVSIVRMSNGRAKKVVNK